ncbi:MAG: helix-turn-helix transcriptional regulator [Candidatus Gastranaerophilaceae bacterium]|jgi:DNA-binding helix-turn-helix protein
MNIDEIKLLTGLRIKNIRERLKYTQEQMSELIQIDISALSKIENGKNFPSYETLYKFFGILKINPTELFDFEDFQTLEDDLTDKIIFEQIKDLSPRNKQKIQKFIKMITE